MIAKIKKILYFPLASYFRFFAAIRLKRWNPKIVVVTGSNGKTTLLHLLESQIGDKARYSHHANSSFGIPFDILDLHRKSLLKTEWFSLILKTPFNAFKKTPKENLYVVEADCDRPGEGKFLASFLRPDIVLWLSTAKTHSMNFEGLVCSHPRGVLAAAHHPGLGRFETVEEAIAYEFGYFIEYAKDAVIINADSESINQQLSRTNAKVVSIKKNNLLKKYEVGQDGTIFEIENKKYFFKCFLPEEVFYSIQITKKLCEILNISFDQSFSRFQMPPGRGSIFEGIKDTTIIDSSYNSNLSSARAVLSMFGKFSNKKKWIVIGDMLELGNSENNEHEKLAEILNNYDFDKIILMGPRVSKYTYPKLLSLRAKRSNLKENKIAAVISLPRNDEIVIAFENPKEVLDFLSDNIKGGEVILFKGARFMEGIIEHLLEDKKDVASLPRREKIWEIRRKKWGL